MNQECATDDAALKDVYFVNVTFCSNVHVHKEAQSPPDMPPSLNLTRVSILSCSRSWILCVESRLILSDIVKYKGAQQSGREETTGVSADCRCQSRGPEIVFGYYENDS